jgi:ferrous iron transport protein B
MNRVSQVLSEDPEITMAEMRYKIIGNMLEECLTKEERKMQFSDMLDKVFLNKYLGIPIFLVMVWAMFQFAIEASAVFMTIIETVVLIVGEFFGNLLAGNEIIQSLVQDGIFGGFAFILPFLAPIFFMFLGIAWLEDSGYFARAAFVMDRILRRMGVHGKTFIPMMLGFGCNVPAVMACRSIEGEKDRMISILSNPYMSCGARLPVYVLFAGAFFADLEGSVIFSIYILGIVVAMFTAVLLRKTFFKGEPEPFVMELPIYRRPKVRESLLHMWERGVVFLRKAGTYLLFGAIVLWALSAYGPSGYLGADPDVATSFAGILGTAIQPIFAPLGFDWRLAASLIFAFLAKEIAVEALGVIFAVEGEAAIQVALLGLMSPASAVAYMIFALLYIPCLATVGILKGETNSWKWTLFSIVYSIVIAYIIAAIGFGIMVALGFGAIGG